MKIYWHADHCDPKMAGTRLRMLKPAARLTEMGVSVETGNQICPVKCYDAVLFSKSYGKEAIELAYKARAGNVPVIYDICDNVFEGKQSVKAARRAAGVRKMLALADHSVFTTDVLRQQIINAVPLMQHCTHIIPDGLDYFDPARHFESGGARRDYDRLEDFLSRHDGALRCIWFGKNQGKKSGMVHLHHAVRELEAFAARHPVTLTVVSNDRMRYWLESRQWRVPHHYLDWRADSFGAVLSRHEVAIIPVERNNYTIGKTINRPATALLAGLGVVGDAIPAYEELRAYIPLDDWQGGLARYAQVPPACDPLIVEARHVLEQRYGMDSIGQAWLGLLRSVTGEGEKAANIG